MSLHTKFREGYNNILYECHIILMVATRDIKWTDQQYGKQISKNEVAWSP